MLRDPAWAARTAVGDELVVEWRALTVALLDELAPLVRTRWAWTPEAAAGLRPRGRHLGRRAARSPSGCATGVHRCPVDSDGTVF